MAAPKKEPGPLPRSFRRVRLELAREPGHPEGSALNGYELMVPLDNNAHIDGAVWREHKASCRVVRFRTGEDDEIGHLIRRPGGAWAFHYDIEGIDEDETGYHFQAERFEVGEYVSVQEDEKQHTFRVVSVEHI